MSTRGFKISTQLALGFGTAIVLGLLIAVLSAVRMQALAVDLDEVANNRIVKVDQLSSLQDNLNGIALAMRNMVVRPDAAFSETQRRHIEALRTDNTRLLALLDQSVALPQARVLLQRIHDERTPYNQSLDRVMALTAAGKLTEATDMLLGEVAERQRVLFKAVDDSVQIQIDVGKGLAQRAGEAANFYAALMFALAVAMAAIAGSVGWLVTRRLMQTLGAEPAQVNQAVQRVAAGDLSVDIQVRSNDSTSTMATVKRMQDALSHTVQGVRRNAEGVASASVQIAQGNHDLSSRTEQQASALEETAASMEQLSSTVSQNADNARQANQLAISASSVAVQGGEVVARVVGTMKEINDASRKIADIISVIDGIAFQTNILALNAAVEAARAGEQGRGFAVVASEVRGLAGRSAQAAKEIKTLIGDSVQRVEQGSALVDQAGTTMGDVVRSIGHVTQLMGEIGAASNEQSAGVLQVGEAISHMDQATQHNAALVEEIAAAAANLESQACALVGNVALFKLPPDARPASTPGLALAAQRSPVLLSAY